MSIQTIYARLVQAGMTPESACGMMGNMKAESAMRSNNVQDGYGYSDEEYTAKVDAGVIDFAGDAIGYGLCQWTLASRKRKMLDFHRQRGVSIGDEDTQVDFCIWELQTEGEYRGLWEFLKSTSSVYEAASRICKEYERPAVNNITERAGYADHFYMVLGGMDVEAVPESGTGMPSQSPAVTAPSEGEPSYWPPRVLAYGMAGPDVVALQGLLIAHGYPAGITGSFDNATAEQLRAWQTAHGLKADAIAGDKSWTALLRR